MPAPRSGRPEAAAAIWSWRTPERVAATGASLARHARLRGLVQAGIGAGIGAAIHAFVSHGLGGVVLAIAGTIGLCALSSPLGLYAAIERVFAATGRGIGRALTWTLLPSIFFLLFAPFAALFRRGRRDSMKRYLDGEAASYWSLPNAPASGQGPDARGRYRP